MKKRDKIGLSLIVPVNGIMGHAVVTDRQTPTSVADASPP